MDDNRIEGAAHEGLGRIQDTWGAATADPESQIHGKLNQVRGAAEKFYGKTREGLGDGIDDAMGQVRELIQDKIDLVTRKPLLSVGGAVAFGLALGLLIRSRRPARIVYVRR